MLEYSATFRFVADFQVKATVPTSKLLLVLTFSVSFVANYLT